MHNPTSGTQQDQNRYGRVPKSVSRVLRFMCRKRRKTFCKTALDEYWLSREKGLTYFETIYHAAGWLIQSNCQAQFVPYHDITEITSLCIFDGFFVIADRRYFEKAIHLYRDVGFFHQFDRAYVFPFSKFRFFLNKQWRTRQLKGSLYYLFLAESIEPMLGTYQNEVNYHWFSCDSWRPQRAQHVWGRLVKCLGLIAGVSFARLTPSLCSLFFALPPSFVPFA